MSGINVKITVDNFAKIKKAIGDITRQQVLVGVPAEEAERHDEDGEKPPINNAALGYIHENGAPEVGIPPRPFLVPGIKSVRDKIAKRLQDGAKGALNGSAELVDKNLHAAGLVAATAAKSKITEGLSPKLKEATLAARRRRGRTGEKPLYDTGALLNSITYVVRKK